MLQDPHLPTLPQVRVEFPYKEALCSASKPGAPSRQVVVVPATSTKMVPFVLLPLVVGKVDVEVKVVGNGVQDHVKKTLLVQVMDIPYALLSVQTGGHPLDPPAPPVVPQPGAGGSRVNKQASQMEVR